MFAPKNPKIKKFATEKTQYHYTNTGLSLLKELHVEHVISNNQLLFGTSLPASKIIDSPTNKMKNDNDNDNKFLLLISKQREPTSYSNNELQGTLYSDTQLNKILTITTKY